MYGLFPFVAIAASQPPKQSSVRLWLLTKARTANGISTHLLTFRERSRLQLFSKSWSRSTMFHLCPFERMMKFRLFEGTTKASRLTKWSNCTWRMLSTLNGWNEKANGTTVHVGIHPSTVIITRLKLDKDRKKILGRKARSRQVRNEKGKYKEKANWENAGVGASHTQLSLKTA